MAARPKQGLARVAEAAAGPLFDWASRQLGRGSAGAARPDDAPEPRGAEAPSAPRRPAAPGTLAPGTGAARAAPAEPPPTHGPPSDGAPYSEAQLAALLAAALGVPIELSFGRARRTPIRVETLREAGAKRHRLRLHRFFAAAPPVVVEALIAWMRAGRRARRACERLDAFIAEQITELPAPAVPAAGRRTAGRVHDLERLVERLASEPSAPAVRELAPPPTVGWGRWPTRPPRRSVQLGSYDPDRHWVRIHPVLDAADVPDWFVTSVLHHELVHALLESGQRGTAPARAHGPEFRALERAYRDHDRAEQWLAKRVDALLLRVGRRVRLARRGSDG